MTLSLVYDIVNGTDADAVPVQANFTAIETYINTELIGRNGAVEMTGELILAGNPTSDLGAAPKQYVGSAIDAIMPVGITVLWPTGTAPAGGTWQLADGGLLSTTDYPVLFALIGYTFGGSGGSFAKPPIMAGNGRFPIGAAGTRPVASTGGSADAVVVTHNHDMGHGHTAFSGNQTVPHTHTYSGTTSGGSPHYHAEFGGQAFVGSYPAASTGTNLQFAPAGTNLGIELYSNTAGESGHTHTFSGATSGPSDTTHSHAVTVNAFAGSTASTGVSGTGANMPPYLGMAYLIRVR